MKWSCAMRRVFLARRKRSHSVPSTRLRDQFARRGKSAAPTWPRPALCGRLPNLASLRYLPSQSAVLLASARAGLISSRAGLRSCGRLRHMSARRLAVTPPRPCVPHGLAPFRTDQPTIDGLLGACRCTRPAAHIGAAAPQPRLDSAPYLLDRAMPIATQDSFRRDALRKRSSRRQIPSRREVARAPR